MMKRDISIITASIVVALLVINFVASRHFFRWDLTGSQLYTLSPATKTILKDLKDIVTVRVFFSKDLPPQLLTFKSLVDDTLDEYRRYSHGQLRVEYVDPAESEEAGREAAMAGIAPLQMNVQEQNKMQVAKIYLGLAVTHAGKRETIPVIANPQNLEYDLTSRILKLTQKEPPTIAWWGPTGEEGLPYGAFRKELELRSTVMDVNSSTLDAKKQPLLIVVSPKALSTADRFVMDQYLMQGGHMVALVDTVEVDNSLQAVPRVSGMEGLLAHYGVGVSSDLVMDRANAYAMFSGGMVNYQVPYPFWIKILPRNADLANPILNGMDSIVLPWTSSLSVTASEGVSVLAKTTDHAKTQNATDGYHLDPETAGSAMQTPGGGEKDLVASLHGKLPSYFASGKESPPKGMSAQSAAAETRVLVVGTSRLVQNQFMQQFPQGAAMVLNAVDVMTIGDQLVGIRSRGQLVRPLDELSPIAQDIVKYANLVGAVFLVMIVGTSIWMTRRTRRRYLQQAWHSSP